MNRLAQNLAPQSGPTAKVRAVAQDMDPKNCKGRASRRYHSAPLGRSIVLGGAPPGRQQVCQYTQRGWQDARATATARESQGSRPRSTARELLDTAGCTDVPGTQLFPTAEGVRRRHYRRRA
eukprot:4100867-Amphidinium_carterae.1